MFYESIEDILTEKIAMAPVQDIEEFLGYQISADILGNLEDRIRHILDNMSEDELLACEEKFWEVDDPTNWKKAIPSA